MNPVLFLDFDGVLHPEPSLSKDFFSQLPLLEAVLRQYPTVDIVISSAWRLDWVGSANSVAVEQLRRHFSTDVAARVVGVTPYMGRLHESGLDALPHVRELECYAWMKSNRQIGTRWMALDDRADYFLPRCNNLMTVDGRTGFVPSDVETFRQRLTKITTPPQNLGGNKASAS